MRSFNRKEGFTAGSLERSEGTTQAIVPSVSTLPYDCIAQAEESHSERTHASLSPCLSSFPPFSHQLYWKGKCDDTSSLLIGSRLRGGLMSVVGPSVARNLSVIFPKSHTTRLSDSVLLFLDKTFISGDFDHLERWRE